MDENTEDLTWNVNKTEIKDAVCRFIDNDEWEKARCLLQSVGIIMLAHAQIQEMFSELKPEGE